jgi:serine/threonine protein kinase/tetratricopeptide (TPR) repeat protein
MIAEKWEQIKDLFHEALELSAEQRQSFLTALGQEDPAIAEEVARLLRAHKEADDFLVEPCSLASDLLEHLEVEEHRFSPGEVLWGRFRIVHLIGQGGMGEVYKAWDEELEDYVALKTLRLEISRHELFTSRFRREIQLARKVTHPNVCRIYDSFKHPVGDGTYISFLSMELLQGQTLAEYLRNKERLSIAEAMPIARQIIAGLSAIHAEGIVHRDLKPSNLVLVPATAKERKRNSANSAETAREAAGQADAANNSVEQSFVLKITDFGIAGRLPDGPSTGHTEVSKLLGTPDYMAPELLEHGRASIQSDIYSLGLILYEMVAGRKPFAGESAWKRLTSDPPLLNRTTPGLPETWNKTIACCLERNRSYRFQSAQTVGESLEENPASLKIPPKPLLVRLQRAAKSRAGVIAIIFLLIVALGVGIYRYFHQSPEIPPGTMVLVTDIAVPDTKLSGITVALKSQLAQSAHFEVEEDSKIVDVLKQMNRKPDDPMDAATARQVAWRSGAPLVISGSLAKNGNGYVLSMRVERVKYNPIFPTFSRTQDFPASSQSDLRTTVHNASTWIREVAGEPEADLSRQDRPVEDTTTWSWQALQSYSEAEKKYSAGDITAALVYLREAIKADPKFAKAHMRLADILVSQRKYNDGYSEWQRAFALVQKHQLTSRESLRILGQAYEDTGDYLRAMEQFQSYVLHYPNDYYAWSYLGSAQDATEQLGPAIDSFEHASLLRPASYGPHEHLAAIYLLLGRYDQAQREAEQVRNLGSWEWATWLDGEREFLQGNYDAGLITISRLSSSPLKEWQSKSFRYRAKFLAEMGRFSEASRILEQGAVFDRTEGRTQDEAEKLLHLSYLAWLQKDFQTARQRALEAATEDDSPARLCDAGTLLARSGFVEEARSLLQILPALGIPRVVLARKRLTGEIAIAEGHRESGIAELVGARKNARPRDQQEYLAYAYATAGQKEQAAKIYNGLVNNKARIWLDVDSPFPGLWSNAVIAYLRTPVGIKDVNRCSLYKGLLSIRAKADPDLRFGINAITPSLKRDCPN